jgi:hypothetical protein
MKADNTDVSIFAHTFIVLAWNLMARSISISTLMYQHLSWVDDSMVIKMPKHKGDQEGKHAFPRHVFANPLNPFICPILSLAMYVFTRGVRVEDSKPVIFGTGADKRFGKWLFQFLNRNEDDIKLLGLNIMELGTHSFRKGVATFCATNPGGPTSISIFQRAGWSLGNVPNRYIFQGSIILH